MHKEDISIEKLTTIEQFHQCEELQRRVWSMSDIEIVPYHLLLIAQKSGGLVLGAFDEEGKMIGLLFGFLRCFAAGYTVTEFVSELRNDLRRSYYVLQRDFEVI
jgi:predicted GNAT superfamily acetyltransferase